MCVCVCVTHNMFMYALYFLFHKLGFQGRGLGTRLLKLYYSHQDNSSRVPVHLSMLQTHIYSQAVSVPVNTLSLDVV